MRHDLIFVLGGPGSGKGTLCARLAAEFGARHLSAGDLLRSAPDVQAALARGQLAPSERTVDLLLNELESSSSFDLLLHGMSPSTPYIVDGFPRTHENRRVFEARTPRRPDLVLFLDCPADVMVGRLMGRKRADDATEAIRERLRIFEAETMPVVRSYDVVTIDAARSPEAVYEDARRALLLS